MKMTIDQNDFVNLFDKMGRGDNFSRAGRRALFDYLDEVDPDFECDIIALCCEFAEGEI